LSIAISSSRWFWFFGGKYLAHAPMCIVRYTSSFRLRVSIDEMLLRRLLQTIPETHRAALRIWAFSDLHNQVREFVAQRMSDFTMRNPFRVSAVVPSRRVNVNDIAVLRWCIPSHTIYKNGTIEMWRQQTYLVWNFWAEYPKNFLIPVHGLFSVGLL
jgi:hypothetical protein